MKITQKAVTVTPVSASKVYGTNDPTFTATVVGTLNNDPIEYTVTREAGENVATYEMRASGEADQGNYKVAYGTGTFTITAADREKAVTVTSYSDTYDAKAHTITVNNKLEDDKVEYSYDNGETWTDKLETYTDVAETPVTILVKVTNPNYNPIANLTGTVTITQKAVTVTAVDAEKTYGEADPQKFEATVAGNLNNDPITYTVARVKGEDVGDYVIIPSGEKSQGNYEVTYKNGNFKINPAERPTDKEHKLSVTSYEGEYDAQSHGITVNNTLPGDVVEYRSSDEDEWTSKNPQYTDVTEEVTVQVRVTNKNYKPNPAELSGTVEITPAEVTVTAENKTKIFGAADPTLTAKTTGTYGTDTVTYTLSRAKGENVGTYTITPAGKELQGNYKVTYKTGTLTINPATRPEGQQLSVTSYEETYDAQPHSITVNNVQDGDKVEYSYDNGKTWVSNKENYTNVTDGTKTILVKVTNKNYAPAETHLTGTVTIKPFEVTVKADDAGKVYDETDPKLTATITPEQRPDNQNIEYTVARAAGENAGTYTITVTAEADQGNYKVATESGTFTISPKARPEDEEHKLSVTPYEDVYDGGKHTITVNNKLEGDVVTYSYDDGATYVPELREYTDVTDTPIKVKVTNPNYTPNEVVLDGFVRVTPATIEVKADNNGKVVGQADPTLTYTVTQDSKVVGEKAAFSGNVVRAEGEETGSYDILAGSLTLINSGAFLAGNYKLTVVPGTFTIEATDYTVTKTMTNVGTGENGVFKAGDTAKFDITVKNNSKNYAVKNVVVEDVLSAGSGTVTILPGKYTVDGTKATIAELKAEETVTVKATYTVTQTDIDNQSKITNIATAAGTGSNEVEIPTEDPKPDFTSSKALINTGTGKDGSFKVGETAEFDITVENTGNVTLHNVTVTEQLEGAKIIAGTGYTINEAGVAVIDTLEVGSTVVVKAEYVITQEDVDSDGIENKVAVEGEGSGEEKPDPENPDVEIPTDDKNPTAVTEKTLINSGSGENGSFKVGETAEFDITVENTGNVTLKDVVVKEMLNGAKIVAGEGYTVSEDGQSATIPTIKVGEKATVKAVYTITQADVDNGQVINKADVEIPGKPDPQEPTEPIPTDPQKPAFTATKTLTNVGTGENGSFKVGETAKFDIEVQNTGNVTLNDVKVAEQLAGAKFVKGEGYTVSGDGTTATIATMEVGANVTLKAEYTITQKDVDNGGAVNSVKVEGKGSGTTDPEPEIPEEPLPTEPENPDFTSSKVLTNEGTGTDGKFKAGETAKFDITVENTGNVTLNNVKVTEQLNGASLVNGKDYTVSEDGTVATIAALNVGEKVVVKATYVVTQEDVDNGGLANAVVVEGEGAGKTDPTPEKPEEEIPTDVHNPAFTATKELTNRGTGLFGKFKVGETAAFDITVTNTGNVTLNDVTVTEQLEGAVILAGKGYKVVDNIAVIDEMEVGATVVVEAEYVITQEDVDNGSVENTVAVEGNGPETEDPKPEPENPKEEIPTDDKNPTAITEKTLTNVGTGENGSFRAGDTANFDITVKNTGNVTLKNVAVKEMLDGAKIVAGEGYTVSTDGKTATIAAIKVGETATVKAQYVVTQADVDNGQVINKAAVEVPGKTDPQSPEEPIPTDPEKPAFTAEKTLTNEGTGADGTFKVGDTAEFDITVKNTGNVTLNDVTVKEQLAGAKIVAGDGYKVSFDGTAIIDTLEVGDTIIVKATYTVTQEDVDNGGTVNRVSVEGEGSGEKDPTPVDPEEQIPTDDKTPGMSVTKTVTSQNEVYNVGDTITYQIVVKNDGNITLHDVVVTDTLQNAAGEVTFEETEGVTFSGNMATIASMAPGETVTLNCSYVVTRADAGNDIVNTAVGDSEETDPTDPSTTDPSNVEDLYNLTINYVYADGRTAAPSVTAQYLAGEAFSYESPTIDGYTPDYAFVRTGADGMPARDVVVNIVYTAIAVPTPTPTPDTPVTPTTPDGGTTTPGGTTDAGTETPAAEPEEVVGAEVTTNEEGEVEVVPVIEEEVPLAKRDLDDHECCILHFLLMLAAMIVYAAYTRSMKKRQERIAELAEELETEMLKRKQQESAE